VCSCMTLSGRQCVRIILVMATRSKEAAPPRAETQPASETCARFQPCSQCRTQDAANGRSSRLGNRRTRRARVTPDSREVGLTVGRSWRRTLQIGFAVSRSGTGSLIIGPLSSTELKTESARIFISREPGRLGKTRWQGQLPSAEASWEAAIIRREDHRGVNAWILLSSTKNHSLSMLRRRWPGRRMNRQADHRLLPSITGTGEATSRALGSSVRSAVVR
jgi:hypothetical protein